MKLMGYLPTGYPSVERSMEIAELYLKGGCDGIEMSLPYPNPVYEPRNVAAAMLYSLWKCNDYDKYFEAIKAFKQKHPDALTVNLVCSDTIYEVGIEKYMEFYKDSKMACLLAVGDVNAMKEEAIKRDMGVSAAITWGLDEEAVQFALSLDKGIVYLVSKPLPGDVLKEGLDTAEKIVKYLKDRGVKVPIMSGVGIRTPEDIRVLRRAGVEGVFLGSSLMANFDDDNALLKTIGELAEAAHGND